MTTLAVTCCRCTLAHEQAGEAMVDVILALGAAGWTKNPDWTCTGCSAAQTQPPVVVTVVHVVCSVCAYEEKITVPGGFAPPEPSAAALLGARGWVLHNAFWRCPEHPQ